MFLAGLTANLTKPTNLTNPTNLTLSPCSWPDVDGRVECGTIDVPENRNAPEARSIALFFVVARAKGTVSGPPVFFFTGGPGSAATRAAAGMATELAALRASRDFVFIDQRGTGRSAPLACPHPEDPGRRLRPMFTRAEAAACRAALEPGADLRFYTTSDAALDVEDVRRALGFRRIGLHGSSYGTRAAWAYAARFPSRASALLLHGPAAPGFRIPLPFARAVDEALAGVIAACAADAACAERFPSLDADVARAFDRVRRNPARVRAGEAGGPLVDASISYGELVEAVRYRLYTAAGAAQLPFDLTRAARGDFAPIANAAIANRARLERALARGMYYSVTCAEDIPFITEAARVRAAAGTRLGDYRVRQQIEACREWPRGAALPTAFAAPLPTPALILVGEFDPATPVAEARRAMALLPQGRLVVVPNGAHGFAGLGIDTCLARVTSAFFTRGSARDLDASCVAAARRPPFSLR